MSNGRLLTIAIDGPAAAGKSTASKALAKRLNLTLVDTGALYRSVALAAKRKGVPWDETQESELGSIAKSLDVRFEFDGEINKVYLSGEDVSGAIRTAETSEGASKIAALPSVRAGLLELQRSLASREPGAVLEGRDIGTVVLPNATVKFFLVASIEKRVQRRHDELTAAGGQPVWDELLKAETERDKRDSERATAPLKQADDAVLIDSSSLSTNDVVSEMLAVVRRSHKAKAPQEEPSAERPKQMKVASPSSPTPTSSSPSSSSAAGSESGSRKARDDCSSNKAGFLEGLQFIFGAAYECGLPRKKQNEREDCTGRTRKFDTSQSPKSFPKG